MLSECLHSVLLSSAGSQEVIKVLDNIKIHCPERYKHTKQTVSEKSGGHVYSDMYTHLDMAQMKSMETAHLYFGASSWSSWLT